MAKVFFVKDGTGDEHTSSGFDIPIGEINKALRSFEKKYFASGPTINSGVAGAFSPYRHVVVEITDGETSVLFPTVGFYYMIGLRPAEAKTLLKIANAPDA
jgi:hypothetical protein